ncbi:UMF1 family MFS transporter [Crossiella equi]|uniref:UMF1 family MFS transporter n=1 Tax=Crossiella equi TaxID=130796 RepID=A0ABS5A7T1_9PSEU|nr:MFS transporter [Crossiella equi]MBP2471760.1 UMF1 family MFS transporter [Crossiella equi]
MSDLDSVATPAPTPEDRRRAQRAWCWYDWANSVFPTSVVTVFLSLYLTSVAKSAALADTALNGPTPCAGDNTLVNCDVTFLGLQFPAGSLWGYLLSFATVIQVLVLPVAGAIADRSQNKRRMLAGFAFTGAVATCALALVQGQDWQLGVLLFTLGNVCWGTSVVVYYAFIPEISTADERDALSSRGWAFGYLGGGCALALQLVLFLGHDAVGLTEGQAVRVCFVITGLWWAGFTLVPLRVLRDRPNHERVDLGGGRISGGFRELGDTLRHARAFPLTLAFLGAYLVFTDGISTVANIAGQYGALELKLEQSTLIAAILMSQFVAFLGGVLHGRLARHLGAKKTILVSLVWWVVMLVLAYFVQAGEVVQFWGLAAGIGLVLGGTNALARSLFSQMVPKGKEGQYFAVYEIGERSTSWLGPLVYAGIGQATGSFRYAIISMIAFFVVGFVLVWLVPVRRAIRAVGNTEPALL